MLHGRADTLGLFSFSLGLFSFDVIILARGINIT